MPAALTFDLKPAAGENAGQIALRHFAAVASAIPTLLAVRIICAGAILWGHSEVAETAPLTALTLVLAASVLLDASFWIFARLPATSFCRPHVIAKISTVYAAAAGAAWTSLPAFFEAQAVASEGPLLTVAVVAGAVASLLVLLPIPAATLAGCLATLAGIALWPLGTAELVVASTLCLGFAWLSLLRADRDHAWLARVAVRERRSHRIGGLIEEFEQSGRGWFWETRADGTLSYVSGNLANVLGCDPKDLHGVPFVKLLSVYDRNPEADLKNERSLGFYLSSKLPFSDLTARAMANDEIWWSLSGSPLHDAYGHFLGFRGIGTDLTGMRRSEAELNRLARYDTLTGLPNRAMIRRTLEEALGSTARRRRRCALFLLDLDRFKAVNDTLGHPAGDALLRLVASRLTDTIGDSGQIGRLGGDEFKAVLPDFEDEEELGKLAERLIANISRPYSVAHSTLSIGVSVGIAISGPDGGDADELIRNADLALYHAKGAGKGTYRYFTPEMHSEAQDRQILENDLRAAIGNGELELNFQPVVNPYSEQVVGFEALARWMHPSRGPISPATFIPLAEEIGFIGQIGEWVLRSACHEAAKWPSHVRVAVNLSPIQFAEPSLPALITHVLASAQLPAHRLELEITESVLLNESTATDEMFARLRTIGVRLALDDFGTGYASLGYLKTAPFNKIKIDQSFVRGAAIEGSRNSAIIRAIVGLAAELGMETTAEGPETQDELKLVKSLGCSLVQGYIFGKPMSAEAALELAGAGETLVPDGFEHGREKRFSLIRSALLRHGQASTPVRLRNVSSRGAMIELNRRLSAGEKVELDIGAGETIAAEIQWSVDGKAGLKFEEAFNFRRLGLAAPGEPAARMLKPQYLESEAKSDSPWASRKDKLTLKDVRRQT